MVLVMRRRGGGGGGSAGQRWSVEGVKKGLIKGLVGVGWDSAPRGSARRAAAGSGEQERRDRKQESFLLLVDFFSSAE